MSTNTEQNIKLNDNDILNLIKILERNALAELKIGDLNQAKRVATLISKIQEQR